jgi:HemK-like putative methylase
MYNILICDDDKDIVNALKIYLGEPSYNLFEAYNGEEALKIIESKGWAHPDVLDMCTGSGAIGISIAAKATESIVTMTDVSEEALKTAMNNAALNGVNRKCVFLLGDMFDALPPDREYDMIICNPPYIESDEIDRLSIEVRENEPRLALDGGRDGLDFYRKIAKDAGAHLRTGGVLVLEIGYDQAGSVKRILGKARTFTDIHKIKDLAGLDRAIIAERI